MQYSVGIVSVVPAALVFSLVTIVLSEVAALVVTVVEVVCGEVGSALDEVVGGGLETESGKAGRIECKKSRAYCVDTTDLGSLRRCF